MLIYAMLVCAGFCPLSCMVLAAKHGTCCVNRAETFPIEAAVDRHHVLPENLSSGIPDAFPDAI